jgi:hypothetical protein
LLSPLIDIDIEEDLVSLVSIIDTNSVVKGYVEIHYPKYTSIAITQLRLYIKEIPGETRKRTIGRKS